MDNSSGSAWRHRLTNHRTYAIRAMEYVLLGPEARLAALPDWTPNHPQLGRHVVERVAELSEDVQSFCGYEQIDPSGARTGCIDAARHKVGYSYVLADVYADTTYGVPWTQSGLLLSGSRKSELQDETIEARSRVLRGIRTRRLATKTRLSRAAVLPSSRWFYHWLIEQLPATLQATDRFTSPLFLSASAPIWVKRWLSHLGIRWTETFGRSVHVSDRYVYQAPNPTGPSVEHLELLRQRGGVGAAYDASWPKRFVISRVGRRRFTDVDWALTEHFRGLGFPIVDPSALSPAQQQALFRHAEEVVAPTGAALANLVWADGPMKLLVWRKGFGDHPMIWNRLVRSHSRCLLVNIDGLRPSDAVSLVRTVARS